ncbi:hypothetical protein JMJ77_0014594, partial [Colletotrichum scovillei]
QRTCEIVGAWADSTHLGTAQITRLCIDRKARLEENKYIAGT